jgi:hypothetical protein
MEPLVLLDERLSTGMPVLGGETGEALFPAARESGRHGPFRLYQDGHYTMGLASSPCDGGCEAAAQFLYSELLAAAGSGLCRVWNYVPGINRTGDDGRENYKSFCLGRALAFEDAFGRGFEQRLPSASAVGTDGDRLVVMFAASTARSRHFENPLQTPAYEYPADYGPRPPSFARATLVHTAEGLCDAFISGTAAIRGHRSIAPGQTAEQLDCTLENMQALGAHCGIGRSLAAGDGSQRHVKVYLRHAADLDFVTRQLSERLLQSSDKVSYLRSDVCRADLNVEIELSAFGVRI